TPDVKSFLTAHKDDPATQICEIKHPDHNNTDFPLIGPLAPPQVNYFKTINNDYRGNNECSLYIDPNPNPVTITVSGWIVWMLPKGFHCDRRIEVAGSGQADLAPGVPHDCL